ncbi:Trm112p-like protein [Novymonas esmeraldas]|uniref:Trm112p-like protein n=1 Tax=Novymonas esmeraldas TaxID=1808958 RepID=A0AAW0EXZ9_9TRYP
MRLLTHNFLACLQCDTHPLHVSATEVADIPVEYDAEFTRRMLARVDYPSLRATFHELCEAHASVRGPSPSSGDNGEDGDAEASTMAAVAAQLPETLDGADLSDGSAILQLAHYALNVVAVRHGALECPACKSTFAIHDFIPNFVPETR